MYIILFSEMPATTSFEWSKLIMCCSKDGKLHLKNSATACLFQNKVVLALNNPDLTLNSFNFNHFVFSLLLFHSFRISALPFEMRDNDQLHKMLRDHTSSPHLILCLKGEEAIYNSRQLLEIGKVRTCVQEAQMSGKCTCLAMSRK